MPHLPFDSSRRLGRGAELGALFDGMEGAPPLSFALMVRPRPHPNSGNKPVLSGLDVQKINTPMRRCDGAPSTPATRERTI